MENTRFSPLAVSLIWMALFGICVSGIRLGILAKHQYLPIAPYLASFACFGGAVGSWSRQSGMGTMIGVALGVIALFLAQFAGE